VVPVDTSAGAKLGFGANCFTPLF